MKNAEMITLWSYANLEYCNHHLGELTDLQNWTLDILNRTAETPKLHCIRACELYNSMDVS